MERTALRPPLPPVPLSLQGLRNIRCKIDLLRILSRLRDLWHLSFRNARLLNLSVPSQCVGLHVCHWTNA
jgi:hypothetical protein